MTSGVASCTVYHCTELQVLLVLGQKSAGLVLAVATSVFTGFRSAVLTLYRDTLKVPGLPVPPPPSFLPGNLSVVMVKLLELDGKTKASMSLLEAPSKYLWLLLWVAGVPKFTLSKRTVCAVAPCIRALTSRSSGRRHGGALLPPPRSSPTMPTASASKAPSAEADRSPAAAAVTALKLSVALLLVLSVLPALGLGQGKAERESEREALPLCAPEADAPSLLLVMPHMKGLMLRVGLVPPLVDKL